MTYYTAVVPASGLAQRLPSALPSPQNPLKQLTITANAGNSGPIATTLTGRLLPGASVTVGCEEPGGQLLSGAAGDGIGLQY